MKQRPLLWMVSSILLGGAVLTAVPVSDARTFRSITPIARPGALPEGAVRLPQLKPVDREVVVRALHAIAEAWNTGRLDPLLADEFVSRSRLLDTLAEVVPRDARLRVVNVRSVGTLDQYRHIDKSSGQAVQVSTVSAIVDTQIEFNDPQQGFQRLMGVNEYILRVSEPVQ